MTAKLSINGIEISVPVAELGEAIRQISGLSTPKQSLPIAAPQLGQQAKQDPTPSRSPESTAELPPEQLTALKFLRFIEDHRNTGAQINEVMHVLGATKPKGVGSKAGAVNRVIQSYGFTSLEDVYTNPRDALGDRLWKPGPIIKDVIAAIEKGGKD